MEVSEELYYKCTRGTFKFDIPVKPRIVIQNAGTFFVNDSNKLDFEGDAEEAGRLFAEYVCKSYTQYIETLLAEERKYAEFLETELEGDGYCLEAIRERYEKYRKE